MPVKYVFCTRHSSAASKYLIKCSVAVSVASTWGPRGRLGWLCVTGPSDFIRLRFSDVPPCVCVSASGLRPLARSGPISITALWGRVTEMVCSAAAMHQSPRVRVCVYVCVCSHLSIHSHPHTQPRGVSSHGPPCSSRPHNPLAQITVAQHMVSDACARRLRVRIVPEETRVDALW